MGGGSENIIFRENFDTDNCSTSSNAQRSVTTYPCYTNSSPITFNGNGLLRTTSADASYEGASNSFSVLLNANTNNPSDKNITIGGINVFNSSDITLEFGLKEDVLSNGSESLVVDFRDANIGGPWNGIALNLTADSNWNLVSVPLTNLPSTNNLELKFTAKVGSKYRIDDVQLTSGSGALLCSSISSITSNSVSGTSETLTWNATDSPSRFEVRIKREFANDWLVSTVNTTTETFENLTDGQVYLVQVRALCADGTKSFWSPDGQDLEYRFTAGNGGTNPNPTVAEIFFDETLDASNEPCSISQGNFNTYNCYRENNNATFNGSGTINNAVSTATSEDYENPSNNNNVFLSNLDKVLVINGIDASTYDDIVLSFGLRKNNVNADGSNLKVEVSENGGTNWTMLNFALPTTDTSNTWKLVTLETGISKSSNLALRFTNISTDEPVDRFRLDDIRLSGIPISGTALKIILPKDGPAVVENGISMYPNPAVDFVTVSYLNVDKKNYTIQDIKLYNMTGSLVKDFNHENKNILNRNVTISLGTLPQGLYVLKTVFSDGTEEDKLLQIK